MKLPNKFKRKETKTKIDLITPEIIITKDIDQDEVDVYTAKFEGSDLYVARANQEIVSIEYLVNIAEDKKEQDLIVIKDTGSQDKDEFLHSIDFVELRRKYNLA